LGDAVIIPLDGIFCPANERRQATRLLGPSSGQEGDFVVYED